MTETIRCPGCSTSYGLRPERVQEGIRRAKCFRCDTIFDIGHEVETLLAAGPTPVPVPPREEPSPFAVFEPVTPPSLTLGDLEGGEDEIMETTLVNFVAPPLEPEQPADGPADEPEEAQDPTATGGFSSAKDAVAKLMGNAPAPAPPPERRTLGSRSPMDVEATLDALDATLSGGFAPQAIPQPPPSLTESGETASTMKLSAQEIQAAMASFAARPRTPEPPAFRPPAPPRVEAPAPPPPPMAVPDPSPAAPELLKIQVEQEVLNNVTIDQVSAWIEQGRVLEYHLVARQFSDHWIEAIKVPALRPIFDRKRREEIGLSVDLSNPPSSELAPPRKSLFGGLFGRN